MTDHDIKQILADLTRESRARLRDVIASHDGSFDVTYMTLRDAFSAPHPRFPAMGKRILSDLGKRARLICQAHWNEIEELARDYILEALKRMAPFADEGWDGTGYKPSELMIFRYFISVSDRERPDRIASIRREALGWLEEGRKRWLAGFVANPFGDPVEREA